MPMEFLVPSLCVALMTKMIKEGMVKKILEELMELEEDKLLVKFHQGVQKQQQKAWHDQHIWHKEFHPDVLVVLYDNKFMQHPSKLHMHWLGPFQVDHIAKVSIVKIKELQGILLKCYFNGSQLKPYLGSRAVT